MKLDTNTYITIIIMISTIKNLQKFTRAVIASALLGFVFTALHAYADYTPQTSVFPHSGIVTLNAAGNGDGDGDGNDLLLNGVDDYADDCESNGVCRYGLKTPSFNNYTDTYVGTDNATVEGITDERRYLVLSNYTNGDTTFTNQINVNAGDIIQGRSYIHNNGIADNPDTSADESVTAENVVLKVPGFHIIGQDGNGKNIYESDNESDANGDFIISQSIGASNVIAGTELISDDAIIHSTDGKKFKLQFTADDSYIKTVALYAGKTSPYVDPDLLVGVNGDNIGSVRGCKEESFYLYTAFRIVDVTAENYDLTIDKKVEKRAIYNNNGGNVTQDNIEVSAGEEVVYRLTITNDADSAVTPNGTKIYDKYDKDKLTITWMSPECTDNPNYSTTKGLITCSGIDLNPGETYTFDFLATVNNSATGIINNDAEIIPDDDSNPDNNSGTNGDLNRNPNDLDTDSSNDDSNATLTVIAPSYDLTIDKKVEKRTVYNNNGGNVTQDNIEVSAGEEVVYRLSIANLSTSQTTPNGTKIYDKYDKDKLTITWMSPECTDNPNYSTTKGLITCSGIDLAPGQTYTFDFLATVNNSATGIINNDAEIIPDDDSNPDNNSGTNGDLNRNPNDFDTNSANDDSNATLNVIAQINGTCGNRNTVYPYGTTEYPAGTEFCATGTVNPTNPGFPGVDGAPNPVTWTCTGENGGTTSPTCQASVSDLTPVDIEIKKSVEGKYWPDIHQTKAGNTVTYTLEYKNNTEGVTAQNVIINDYPDTEKIDMNSVQFTTEAGVTCKITQDSDALVAVLQGRYIECTVGNLDYSTQYHTLSYTATINANVASGTNIDNTVEICTDNPETNDNNNTDHARVQVLDEVPEYDVTIEKTVNTKKEDTVAVGSTVEFKLAYENLSTSKDTAIDVKIVDTYEKDKIEIIESSLPTGCTNNSTDGKITCVLGNLIVGQKGEITYQAKLLAGFTTGETVNTAVITPNPDNDTNSANDTSSAKVIVINPNEYDLTINKLVDGVKNKNVVAGQTLTYTLEYQNLTPGTVAKDVKIFDIFDNDNLDEYSVQFTNLPAGVTCEVTSDDDPVYYIMTGEHIACTLGDLAYGDAKTITYTITVNDNVTAGTKIKNTAEIKPNPDNDTNPNNDVSETEVTVVDTVPEYDLEINKTVNTKKEDTVAVGSTVEFKLDYKNLDASKDTAIDVKIVDTYEKDKIEIIESSLPTGCTNNATDGKITCVLGNLTVSQSGSITYQAKLLPAFTTGETVNTAVITPNPDNDTNSANDTSSATVKIQSTTPTPTPTHTPTPTTPTNGVCGTAAQTYSSSTTAYPANAQFCKYGTAVPNPPAFPAQGASVSWTCQGANGGANVTCTASRYTSSTGGGSGGGCNTNANIDLNIMKYVKIENGNYEPAGSRETAARLIANKTQKATYKIIISNAGNASAHNVKIKDTFASSDGVTHGAIQTQSGATYEGGIFTIVAAVPANGSREFTYTTTLSNDGNATGLNTARIQSFDTDYTCPKIDSKKGVGRTSVAYVKTAGVAQNPDYILDKTADKHSVKAGEIVTYTLSIKNTGNVDMKDVVLIDKFPSEFLEPTDKYKKRLVDNRTLQFTRKFLPVGDTFKKTVTMIVREGVPQGTEIQNILTGRSSNVSINDKSMETVIVSEGNTPICPTGYKWNADISTCKRIYTPHRNIQTGLDNPFLPIGIMMLGVAFIIRRKDIAEFLSSKI